jgi:hypothetical protein
MYVDQNVNLIFQAFRRAINLLDMCSGRAMKTVFPHQDMIANSVYRKCYKNILRVFKDL